MASEDTSAYPIQRLREQATALEAALTVCLAKPAPRAVHRLRTSTRRIEAQLLLLDQLKGLPRHRREAEKLRKWLKKLRGLAGTVRDFDVQRKLISSQLTPKTAADARRLRSDLKKQRDNEAEALVGVLERRSSKVSLAMERLLEVLKPAEDLEVPATQLVELARGWFARNHRRAASTEKQLHTTRKVAKLVRYIAEGAPESARAKKLAKDFENIQQAGGEWHDWLQLAGVAGDEFKKDHPLVQVFEHECGKSYGAYCRKLAKLEP
jgi:CHAD domain-containing protein